MAARAAEQEPERDDLLDYVRLLWQPGEVRELRVPKYGQYQFTASGYFDSPEAFVAAARAWDGRGNCFITLNPVDRSLLGRANNRVLDRSLHATADTDTVRRTWLPVDVDPVRPSGISSTDVELDAARFVAMAIARFLRGEGWPEPIVVMSGNGWHLLYRVDLENSADSTALVKGVLESLGRRFDTESVHVDPVVFNASRIFGCAGTLKMKGDETSDRPHRRSRLERIPDVLDVVSDDQLRALVAPGSRGNSQQTRAGKGFTYRGTTTPRSLVDMLTDADIEFREQPPDASGVTWYHVAQCPFHDDGKPFECGVGQKLPDGAYAGHCFHPEGNGRGWAEFKEKLGLRAGSASRGASPISAGERPRIVISNRPMHEIADDAWDVILDSEVEPLLFNHGDAVTRLRRSDAGTTTQALDLVSFKGHLDRAATWQSITRQGEFVAARPPKDVVEDMLRFPERLPLLRGIAGTPVVSPDGSINTARGYQTDTAIFYEPIGRPVAVVPDVPTTADVARARRLLLTEWLGDFPFETDASRTHVVAAALSVVARDLVDCVPIFAIDAPTPGSGKGFISQSIGIVASGFEPSVTSLPTDEEEMRKRITTELREGHSLVLFDNVKTTINSGVLAGALTAPVWSDRILGSNTTFLGPNRAVWMATGNNLRLDGDVTRRTIWIRLDPRCDRPWERTGFRHDPFIVWVKDNRHELVWALLVLVRNWVAKGRPLWKGKAMGSFERWCATIGGVLEAADIPGFMGNREELYRRADRDTDEWTNFTAFWHDTFGTTPVGVAELFPIVQGSDLLPSVFASARADASERSLKTRLGRAIRDRENRGFGGLFIRSRGTDAHNGSRLYALEPAEPSASDDQGSAEVPHENDPFSDSNPVSAEPAEPAELLIQDSNRSDREGLRGASTDACDGAALEVPQVPHVPQPDSIQVAEPHAEPAPDEPDVPRSNIVDVRVPRCVECGTRMSVVAVSDRCGRCQSTSGRR